MDQHRTIRFCVMRSEEISSRLCYIAMQNTLFPWQLFWKSKMKMKYFHCINGRWWQRRQHKNTKCTGEQVNSSIYIVWQTMANAMHSVIDRQRSHCFFNAINSWRNTWGMSVFLFSSRTKMPLRTTYVRTWHDERARWRSVFMRSNVMHHN